MSALRAVAAADAAPLPAALAVPPVLRRLCRVVRVLVVAGAVVQVAVLAWFWLSPDWVAQAAPQIANIAGRPIALDEQALWLGAAASLLPLGIGLYGLWQLWLLFGHYARGAALTQAAQRPLQRFAWAVLAGAVAGPVYRTVLGLVLTLGNPPGQRMLAIGLGSTDYLLVLLGAVLLAIATVMAQAVRVAEENREFV
jgi:hypothetical protein